MRGRDRSGERAPPGTGHGRWVGRALRTPVYRAPFELPRIPTGGSPAREAPDSNACPPDPSSVQRAVRCCCVRPRAGDGRACLQWCAAVLPKWSRHLPRPLATGGHASSYSASSSRTSSRTRGCSTSGRFTRCAARQLPERLPRSTRGRFTTHAVQSFSAIIGPNGSGKSNVIDAMLFVFGKKAKQVLPTRLALLAPRCKRPLACAKRASQAADSGRLWGACPELAQVWSRRRCSLPPHQHAL